MTSSKRESKYIKIARKIYDYLATKHLGRANGVPQRELLFKFDIDKREWRKCTNIINTSGEFESLVGTCDSVYMCATLDECKLAIKNTYKNAISHLKKARAMERKVGLNGQMKLPLGDDYSDIVRTF